MRRAVVRTVGVLIFLIGVTAANAQPVRTWVSSGGSDANPCTRTLPCRNFAAAVAAVAAGGEVAVLDSAGYGPVTIDKSVSVVAPPAVQASIAPTTGAAVTVAAVDGTVVLRGLYLNSQGAETGVNMVHHGNLYLDRMVVHGFDAGVFFDSPTGSTGVFLRVSDTVARKNNDAFYLRGSSATGTGAAIVSLDRVSAFDNFTGVETYQNVKTRISNSSFAGHSDAIYTTTMIAVENCVVTQNLNGISVSFPGVGRVSNTTVTGNDEGVYFSNGASLLSFGNNRVSGNTTDGSFSGLVPLK